MSLTSLVCIVTLSSASSQRGAVHAAGSRVRSSSKTPLWQVSMSYEPAVCVVLIDTCSCSAIACLWWPQTSCPQLGFFY